MDSQERVERRCLFESIKPTPFVESSFRNYREHLDDQAARILADKEQGIKVYLWRAGKLLSGKTYLGEQADRYLEDEYGIKIGTVAYKRARDKVVVEMLRDMEVPVRLRRTIASIPLVNKHLPPFLVEAQEGNDVVSVEIAVLTGAKIGDQIMGSDGGIDILLDMSKREGVFAPFAGKYRLVNEVFYGGPWVSALGLLFRILAQELPSGETGIEQANLLLKQFGRKRHVATTSEVESLKKDGAPTHFIAAIDEQVHLAAQAVLESTYISPSSRLRNPDYTQGFRDQALLSYHMRSIMAEDNPFFRGDSYHDWYNNPRERDLLRTHDPMIITRAKSLMHQDLSIFDHVPKATH